MTGKAGPLAATLYLQVIRVVRIGGGALREQARAYTCLTPCRRVRCPTLPDKKTGSMSRFFFIPLDQPLNTSSTLFSG